MYIYIYLYSHVIHSVPVSVTDFWMQQSTSADSSRNQSIKQILAKIEAISGNQTWFSQEFSDDSLCFCLGDVPAIWTTQLRCQLIVGGSLAAYHDLQVGVCGWGNWKKNSQESMGITILPTRLDMVHHGSHFPFTKKKHATVSKMFFLITKIHGIYGWCFRARRFGTAKRGVDPTTAGSLQNWLLSGNLLVEISNQWPFQEPIDWSYLPYIRPILKAYVREYPSHWSNQISFFFVVLMSLLNRIDMDWSSFSHIFPYFPLLKRP